MKNRKILIVGSGIAGPTLAYWLNRHGFEPTLVERAPALRRGGYVVDFWGVGYDVAEKMGLLPVLNELRLPLDTVRLVNKHGKRTGGFGLRALQATLGERYLSVLRSDLSRVIYDSLEGNVRTIFGDTVTQIDQSDSGIFVEFQHAPAEEFDLVIGAGGLHSRVRNLVFGPDARFEKYLGYYVASFSTDHYPHQDPKAAVSYSAPGRQVTRYSLQDGRTVFLFVFSSREKLDISPHDVETQKDVLNREFRRDEWECNDILRRLNASSDIYFDPVSQIHMEAWSQKRATLVGDSCGCPSLLAGQGSSLAMAGAYILAGELRRARGEHQTAFANYERCFHPFIDSKQKAAEKFAGSFVPKTQVGIFVRNQVTRLIGLPFVADLAMGPMLRDSITLPTYDMH